MKIWHISDTHGYHDLLKIPFGIDMVIHSGDCSNSRDPYTNELEVKEFIRWYKSLSIKHKIYVAGNHDTSIEKGIVRKEDFEDIIYLENEYVDIENITIFGSPYTPTFNNWAFNKDRNKLHRLWKNAIYKPCDIIVTHGAPKGILDLSENREGKLEFCGDKSLFNRVKELEPTYHLFGHIHNCGDIINTGLRTMCNSKTLFSNGSVVTDRKFGILTSNGNIL